jgi:hypothetical protein
MDSTIAGSMNDNINMDSTIAGSMNARSYWLLARKVESKYINVYKQHYEIY